MRGMRQKEDSSAYTSSNLHSLNILIDRRLQCVWIRVPGDGSSPLCQACEKRGSDVCRPRAQTSKRTRRTRGRIVHPPVAHSDVSPEASIVPIPISGGASPPATCQCPARRQVTAIRNLLGDADAQARDLRNHHSALPAQDFTQQLGMAPNIPAQSNAALTVP